MIEYLKKKPVIVATVLFDGDNYEDVWELTGPSNFRKIPEPDGLNTAEVFDYLHETWIGAKPTDRIIRGPKGEFYPIEAGARVELYEAEPVAVLG